MAHTPKITIPNSETKRRLEVDPVEIHCAFFDKNEPSPFNMLPSPPALRVLVGLGARDTLREQSAPTTRGKRHRALRVVVSEKLVPLTTATGKSFLDAWLDTVTCHACLWKHGIKHSDPSPWNLSLMYHPTRKCGVLTDFDISTVGWLARVPGIVRTGTIPFMAMELLKNHYWEGNTTWHYYHELEALIWVLPFVFLAYDNGKFDPRTRFIEGWMTSNYNACYGKKLYFACNKLATVLALVKPAFKDHRFLMIHACIMIRNLYLARLDRELQDDQVLDDLNDTTRPPNVPSHTFKLLHSASMWDEFIIILSKSGVDTTTLCKHRPVFDPAQIQDLFRGMKAIYDSFLLPAK